MQADDQRITKKDAVFDNVKILNGNQIPLTNTLTGKLPLRGSLIALKSGNIHDLYYADGLQWVQLTDGGTAGEQPLADVLTVGNFTGGNDIEITDGDRIVSETDGTVWIRSLGGASDLNLDSEGTAISAISMNASLGGIQITSGTQGIDTSTSGQFLLKSSQDQADAIRILTEDLDGGIDIDAGTGGIAVDSVGGQIALTSTQAELDAIRINATAGGIDIDSVQQLSIVSQNALTVLGTSTVTVRSSDSSVGISSDLNNVILSAPDDAGNVILTAGESVLVTATGTSIDLDASSSSTGQVRVVAGTELNIVGGNDFITHDGSLTVTQLTSVTTSVACNSRTGIITMAAGTIDPNSTQEFIVLNSTVKPGDLIFLTSVAVGDGPALALEAGIIVDATSFVVKFSNTSFDTPINTARKVQFMIIRP